MLLSSGVDSRIGPGARAGLRPLEDVVVTRGPIIPSKTRRTYILSFRKVSIDLKAADKSRFLAIFGDVPQIVMSIRTFSRLYVLTLVR